MYQVIFKKLAVAIGFGILLVVNPTATGENSNLLDKSSKKEIDVSKISIGGIKLGMKEKEIIKKLGRPKSRTTKYDDVCYSSYITTWKYNELEIEGLSTSNNVSQSEVHLIKTSSSHHPTDKGIKVGDRIGKAQKTYSAFLSRNDTKNYLAYPNDAFGGLVFSISKQGVIREIQLLGASC
ncbi:MAG: hypothetical protein KME21_06785 [Desmonostoc vinosum HA7617-LM4]|nr:hypothetical protein [Desmonostoc vinosum HA7617-LM4]